MTEGKAAGRPLGATGETVRKNIRRIRDSKGISGPELSAKLDELHRPIPPLGIHRIESGQRRVDVDDLVNLALALDISPITLLMPEAPSDTEGVSISGYEGEIEARRAWGWLSAKNPLTDTGPAAKLGFSLRSRPAWSFEEK